MKVYMKYLLWGFAICVFLRISLGMYFNNSKADTILNQLSWVYVILFLVGVVSIRGYYYFLNKKNIK